MGFSSRTGRVAPGGTFRSMRRPRLEVTSAGHRPPALHCHRPWPTHQWHSSPSIWRTERRFILPSRSPSSLTSVNQAFPGDAARKCTRDQDEHADRDGPRDPRRTGPVRTATPRTATRTAPGRRGRCGTAPGNEPTDAFTPRPLTLGALVAAVRGPVCPARWAGARAGLRESRAPCARWRRAPSSPPAPRWFPPWDPGSG